MIDMIVDAIQSKKLISLNYYPGTRVIEPHAIGWSKDGKLLLRAYQRSGASASGEHAYWKLFRIDRAGPIHEMDEQFVGPRQQYNRDDSAMKGGIIARL
jgi:predicted DNA-binding transcriptional regulator YafY